MKNELTKIYESMYKESLEYLGSCIEILDVDYSCDKTGCYDATQLQQFIDNGKEITAQEFIKLGGKILNKNNQFFQNDNILWQYNSKNDTHYFYAIV